jgi:hypothetical protein
MLILFTNLGKILYQQEIQRHASQFRSTGQFQPHDEHIECRSAG